MLFRSSVPLKWAERARDGGYNVLCPQSTELQGRAVPGALEFPPTCLRPAPPSMKSHRGPGRGPRCPSWWHLLGSLCQPLVGRNSSGERPVQEEEVGKHPPGSTAAAPDEANKPPRRWGSEPLGPRARGRAQGSRLCDSPGRRLVSETPPLPREASRDTLRGPLALVTSLAL